MKIQQPGAHLDHMMRQTRMHHVQLSMMADVKANALMTISAVMMTFSAPAIFRDGFQEAVIVLICSSLMTIVFATLAVMPKLFPRIGKREGPTPSDSNYNLLFFGTFSHMPWTQFESEMEELMNDPSKNYEAQVREVFVLGQYLAQKKYKLLGFAYLTFTTGLVASGAVFLWCMRW